MKNENADAVILGIGIAGIIAADKYSKIEGINGINKEIEISKLIQELYVIRDKQLNREPLTERQKKMNYLSTQYGFYFAAKEIIKQKI